MSKTTQIHATKPKIDSLLGIKYIFQSDSFRITAINDSSIFKDGELRIGHEIVEVNGSSVANESMQQVKTLLASLGDQVIFVVKNSWSADFGLQAASENGDTGSKPVKNFYKTKVPHFLEGMGVTMRVWQRIYQSLNSELLPAVSASSRMEFTKQQEMSMFSAKKASKEFDLFQQSAKHDGKVFRMTQSSAALANSATLIASNVLALSNALLQPYGLMCTLNLEKYELPKFSESKQKETFEAVRIHGIEFTPISIFSDEEAFTISCSKSEDGSVITEPDTTRWC